ncbi:hypothetical protein K9L16_01630 [Candidatus Pacearchaeota archaeon]|nr:hypothetical protein [Candidatus Pacearchaeota archaeon]
MTNKSKLVSLALAGLLSFSVSFPNMISAQEKQNKAPHILGRVNYNLGFGVIEFLLYDMNGEGYPDEGIGEHIKSGKKVYWKDYNKNKRFDDAEFVSWEKYPAG